MRLHVANYCYATRFVKDNRGGLRRWISLLMRRTVGCAIESMIIHFVDRVASPRSVCHNASATALAAPAQRRLLDPVVDLSARFGSPVQLGPKAVLVGSAMSPTLVIGPEHGAEDDANPSQDIG